jgi:hypothetical protein
MEHARDVQNSARSVILLIDVWIASLENITTRISRNALAVVWGVSSALAWRINAKFVLQDLA